MNRNNLVYFQDYIDENTIMKGYIDKETEKGKAFLFKKELTLDIDLERSGVKNNPHTNKEYAAKFAYEKLKAIGKEI